jgi:MFS transporter, DHA2 family, multidrug resistance protein
MSAAADTLMLGAVPASRRRAISPWVIAVTVTLATFMELLDTSIANVSLPHIAGGLSTGQDESTWVLSSYLVANAVVLPLSAWFSRLMGRKNYYMLSVALFTASSLLCGLAPSLGWLIFFRVLQGTGGGGLAPVEQAILVDTFPAEKRATAFAVYSIAIVTAPAIGPTLGGWITDTYSWRWVFFINIPIGLLSLLLSGSLISDPPQFTRERLANKGKLKVDYIGILLVAIGFGCLEVVLDKGEREDWLQSSFIVAFLVTAIVALVAGVVWELKRKDPVVDLTLLKERNFALASGLYFIVFFILFASTLLVPLMLQSLFGYTATDAGMVLSPGAMVIVVLVPLVVMIMKRLQPRWMMGLGLMVCAFASFSMTQLNLNGDYSSFVIPRMVLGLGFAFLFIPLNLTAYSYLPLEKNNRASSLINLFRNLGGSFGVAFVATMLARRSQFHQTVLGAHISAYDQAAGATVRSITGKLVAAGVPAGEALTRAQALIYATVQKQSALLAFLDVFWLLCLLALAAVPLVLLIKNIRRGAPASAGH